MTRYSSSHSTARRKGVQGQGCSIRMVARSDQQACLWPLGELALQLQHCKEEALPPHLTLSPSDPTPACRSRWLVGSSRSSRSGSTNSARARATRMRHPPENVFVGRRIIAASNERPDRIVAARASAPVSMAKAGVRGCRRTGEECGRE
eukprot:363883-Chlamydomonas_euryale.AAC.1